MSGIRQREIEQEGRVRVRVRGKEEWGVAQRKERVSEIRGG